MSVSGTASQYAAAGHSSGDKGDKERNPYGVAEATLSYTWDWHAKSYREGLERVKGGFGVAQTPHPLNPLSSSVPALAREKTVPKISVNVPGRRQSTLSATATASAGPNSALIAKLPGLGRSSPSRDSFSSGMPPPPVPTTSKSSATKPPKPSVATSSISMAGTAVLGNHDIIQTPMEIEPPSAVEQSTGSSAIKKEESIFNPSAPKPDETKPARPSSEAKSRSISKASIDSIDDLILPAGSGVDVDTNGDGDGDADLDLDLDLAASRDPNPDTDTDIDADIAEVMGDAEQDVDADIAEALGEDPGDNHEDNDMSDMEEVELDQAFGLDEMPASPSASTLLAQSNHQTQQSGVPLLSSGISPGLGSQSHSRTHSHTTHTHSRSNSNSNPNGILSHQDQSLLQSALEVIEDIEDADDMDDLDLLLNATAAATTSAPPPPTTSANAHGHNPPVPSVATAMPLPPSFDNLGIGEPPVPPGPGSAYLLDGVSPLDNTLPLATSALRSTTTPLSAEMTGPLNPSTANLNSNNQ